LGCCALWVRLSLSGQPLRRRTRAVDFLRQTGAPFAADM